MENQELNTEAKKTSFLSFPEKILASGLTLSWFVAFVGLIVAIRSLLAPAHFSVWIVVAWVIAEIFLSLLIFVHLVGFVIELFRSDDEGAGTAGVFLAFGMFGFGVASIAMPVNRNFGALSIVNFIVLSLVIVIDIVLWVRARNAA